MTNITALTGRASRRAFVRQRLEDLGVDALSDTELLAVLGVAANDASSLFELVRMAPSDLITSVGRGGATSLRAAIELGRRALRAQDSRPRLRSSREVFAYLEPRLAGLARERFHVLCLNSRSALLADVCIAEGSAEAVAVDPRQVFSAALECGANAILLAHNHPSSATDPSSMDLTVTSQLVQAGKLLCITVVDHLIIGAGGYVSLADRGLCGLGTRGTIGIAAT